MCHIEKLFVNVDGGSRGNPGEASIGVSVSDSEGNVIEEVADTIGRATNNIAEYKALIQGCRTAIEYSPSEVVFFTDSQLVANQVNGIYETREPHLQKLRSKVLDLLEQFDSWKVSHVERRANRSAHLLADRAIRSAAHESDRSEQQRDLQKAIDILSELDQNELKRALAYLTGLRED